VAVGAFLGRRHALIAWVARDVRNIGDIGAHELLFKEDHVVLEHAVLVGVSLEAVV